ncbi:cysteine hydrolase family protein [Lentilactobacillus buchneri]|uniref:Isochorismatase family protein n=1 Tax=Lentilactobacillus buchneri subsp. silagei CD034 TaxID=1071400 RepID=J9W4H7_LENBU|nr:MULTISPECIES: cysteine hydrolase family protein [Lentilactobacillus]MCC6101434.1 cysteine hydrolase [Lactobacillus sp.]AFS01244.1 isochorismatase family protein [Lentilactobacillus buchneri subsp. silagei CD034]MCT2901273.1 cysteine hydrolase [Lentilactobacillus buchneri]MCT3541659.1 cysteine hydrolase [Lentilactobacillus buchneri]MCT3543950.1 cysteine hydrolase [Lentilactobacillus buchneri]
MNKSALIVIDLQNGLNKVFNFPELVAKINRKIDAYHQANLPVVFMQHVDDELVYGTDSWQIVSGTHRLETDRVFLKYHSDSFYETGLESYLRHQTVNTLDVCGLQTEYCIDTAIRVGHDRGFRMITTSGLNSTFDTDDLTAQQIIKHHEGIWDGSFAEVQAPI